MKNTDFYAICQRRAVLVFVMFMLLSPTMLRAQQADSSCAPRQLPWATSFEEDGVTFPLCWTTMQSYNGYPYVYRYGYAHTGTSSMALAAEASQHCMLATPRWARRADSLHVGFWLTMNDGYGMLQVGLVTDTADTSSFSPMLTLDLGITPLGYYEFYTDGFPSADSVRVAFLLTDGRVTFDDFEVEASTLCRRPWHPVVGAVTHTTIALSWSNPGGTATGYVVRAIDTAASDTSWFNVTGTSATLTMLTPATAYRLDVASLCGGDTTSWMPVGIVATDVACRVPLGVTLAASSATAAVLEWQHDTDGSVAPNAMCVGLYDMTASAAFGDLLSFEGSHAFLQGLATGHRYRATLQAVCQNDTSAPVQLVFTPLADACVEHVGTVSSSSPVTSGSSRYCYGQMLYPKSLLAGSDTLYGLALRVDDNNMLFPRMLSIYVGQTDDSILSTNIISALMNCVNNNVRLAPGDEGWIVVPFVLPVGVDTARNLVVAVLDNTGAPTGTIRFGVHNEAYGNALFATSESQPIDPLTFDFPMYTHSHVADIRLYGDCPMSECQAPAAVVTAFSDTTLTLQWAGGSDTTVIVCTAEGGASTSVTVVASSSCTIGGLAAATRYALHVGTLCGPDTAFGEPMVAMTACGTLTVPYTTDFAAGAHPCWQGVQDEVYGGVMLDGTLVSPQVNVALGTLQLRLALRPTDGAGRLRVGAYSAGQTVWIDTIVPADIFVDEWVTYFDGYSGSADRMVVDAEGGWLIQQATIESLDDCLPPRRMTVSALGAESATISWQADAVGYDIHFTQSGADAWSVMTTTQQQFALAGLTPSTEYSGYVVAHCSAGGEASAPAWFRFTTECGNIRYFPYEQDFEVGDATLGCWTVAYGDPACATANPVTFNAVRRYSGQRALRFSSYNNVESGIYDQYFISPRIQSTDSIYLSFRCYKDNYDEEPFQVGFSTYGNNVEDFLWMGVVEPQAGQWMLYEIGLPAASRYVAIRYMGRGNYHLFIDNLVITGPGCAVPQLTMIDEQTDAITLQWEADADTAVVAITDGVWQSNVEGTVVVGDGYSFNNLLPGRSYTVGVRFRCGDGHFSDWTTRRVSTIDTSCVAPADLTLDSVGLVGAWLSWMPMADGQQCQVAVFSDEGLLWQSGRLQQTSLRVTGLEQNRSYAAIVRAFCADVPGPWSDTLRFTTNECMAASDVDYERVDFRTIILSWNSASGRCRVEYGPEGFVRGTGNVVENVSPCRLGNLDPYANYDIYIQSICEADVNVYSDSVVLLQVPTGVGIDGADELRLAIMPNPASTVVTIAGLAPSAEVAIVDVAGRRMGAWTATGDRLDVDVTAFAPGAYFVRVVAPGGTAVGKLIVR